MGIFREDNDGKRIPNVIFGQDNYDQMEHKIKAEIKNFFALKLGRPEIFNRFGDNFVVFDFIRPEVAESIFENNMNTIKRNLKNLKNIILEYDQTFTKEFIQLYAKDNLEMGGRGIVNRIETHIKNGLTNYMFKSGKLENCTIQLTINNKELGFQ